MILGNRKGVRCCMSGEWLMGLSYEEENSRHMMRRIHAYRVNGLWNQRHVGAYCDTSVSCLVTHLSFVVRVTQERPREREGRGERGGRGGQREREVY